MRQDGTGYPFYISPALALDCVCLQHRVVLVEVPRSRRYASLFTLCDGSCGVVLCAGADKAASLVGKSVTVVSEHNKADSIAAKS